MYVPWGIEGQKLSRTSFGSLFFPVLCSNSDACHYQDDFFESVVLLEHVENAAVPVKRRIADNFCIKVLNASERARGEGECVHKRIYKPCNIN